MIRLHRLIRAYSNVAAMESRAFGRHDMDEILSDAAGVAAAYEALLVEADQIEKVLRGLLARRVCDADDCTGTAFFRRRDRGRQAPPGTREHRGHMR